MSSTIVFDRPYVLYRRIKIMNRLKLLSALETVAPALSSKDTIPILTHLWFTGKQVLAFNDGIAISTVLATDWQAAVPSVLIQLLRASGAEEVDFTVGRNGELHGGAKAARMNIKLPTLPPDDFVFTMPTMKKDETPSISGDDIAPFLDAMSFAIQCVASEATVPEQLGVTLLPGAGGANTDKTPSMWSTNEKALFYTKIRTNKAIKRMILSEEFCKQMLNLRNESEKPALYFRDDAAIFKAGDTTLFGKLIHAEQPLDFEDALSRHFPDLNKKPKLSEVPIKMKNIIERACIIVGSNGGNTEAMVKDHQVHFRSYDQRTDQAVADVMKIGNGQPDLAIKFSPVVAKIALDNDLDKIRLTKSCVIFTKDDLVLLVTAKS
jgi:DNA polymerase III sliding clamp (beta) subunit (PCNA family)